MCRSALAVVSLLRLDERTERAGPSGEDGEEAGEDEAEQHETITAAGEADADTHVDRLSFIGMISVVDTQTSKCKWTASDE